MKYYNIKIMEKHDMRPKTLDKVIAVRVKQEIYDFVTDEKGVYSYSSFVENLLMRYMQGVKSVQVQDDNKAKGVSEKQISVI